MRYSICWALLFCATVAGCSLLPDEGSGSDDEVAGRYEATELIVPGPADGLHDLLEQGARVEMTLGASSSVEGRYVKPCSPDGCAPENERTVRFEGTYSSDVPYVRIDVEADESLGQFPADVQWSYAQGVLAFERVGLGPTRIRLQK